MFEFICTGGPYSDCTSTYHIVLDKSYCVGEFIEILLKEFPNEWGYIGLYCKGEVFGYPKCEYNHGVIIDGSFTEDILMFEIESVRASGGWSRMDYLINLDFDEIEKTNREALFNLNNEIAQKKKEKGT